VIVVTEGLLVYLEETVVRSLAEELRQCGSMQRWVLEAVTPEVLKRSMRTWGTALAPANAEWKFAHPNGFDFYRPLGWSPVATRPFFAEARRLRREVRHAWIIRTLSALSKEFRERLASAVVYGVMQPGPR
jgi:O-methyltransferase involved in polyketide biosynthesis